MEAAEPQPGLSWQEDDDIQEEAQSIVVLERVIKLKRSNSRNRKLKGLRRRRKLWSRNSPSFGAIEDACVTFGSSRV